jgi:class 3 adenylate cyclase
VTRAAGAAEYKQVTVLFADVVHSMDIARSVGAERLREIMAGLVDTATSVVKRYGGTVDKFTGDGIMAVFGAPVALEDHALRACLAALGIQEEVGPLEFQLRIGIDSGQVIAGEIGSGALGYTAIGEHVGMAQRMETAAPPGGVMLSASTARLLNGAVTLGELELVQVKGAEYPVPARRLLGVGTGNHAPPRIESNLVGRQWEMTALEGLLNRAINGQGAVVGVSGPAGIGKSRLLRELTAMAANRGLQVFTAHCESHTSQVPFHAVKTLFRAATGVEGLDAAEARARIAAQPRDVDPEDRFLFEDLLGIADPDTPQPQIDPDARRRRLTAMVNSASLGVATCAVYVIEDAHWIDEASESLLADFLSVVPQTPLLTLITHRPEYRGALSQVVGAQSFALAPLSDRETTTLVASLLGPDSSAQTLGETIVERAAGTPLFAEEIVLELAERGVLQGEPGAYVATVEAAEVTVPATLQATIASRIDRLDPRAKRTLGAAAAIGSRFGAELLTALGVEPAFTELLAARLIDQVTFTRSPEYVFHQPLIRTVAYESQLRSDRADLHRRVAAAIEAKSVGSADENAALIAEHLEAAGDLESAFDWHMRAGTWLNNRDFASARVSWERASHVADALPTDHPGRLAMQIAPRTAICATDWRLHADDSNERFDELRKLCALAGDKTSLALAIMGPMSVHAQRGEVRESQRLASELIALLDSIGDAALAAEAAFGAISMKAQAGEMETVLRWAQATIDWADGDPTKGGLIVGSPLAVARVLRGLARAWLGLPGWCRDLDDGVAMGKQSGEPMTQVVTVSWKCGTGPWHGLLCADDDVVNTADDGLRTAQSSGDDYAVAMAEYILGSVMLLRGRRSDRESGYAMLTRLREDCIRRRYLLSELPVFDTYIGRELTKRGDVESGIVMMRNALDDMTRNGQVGYYIPTAGFLVEALLERGDNGDLVEAESVAAAIGSAPADGSVVRDIWALRMRALLARARGDGADYRQLRDRYREMAASLGFEGHMRWAATMP